jgi:hypothetical protein
MSPPLVQPVVRLGLLAPLILGLALTIATPATASQSTGEPPATTTTVGAPRSLEPVAPESDDSAWLLATAGALFVVVLLAILIPRDRQRDTST